MKPQRAGYLMMRNLLAGGFGGPVLPVTPAWKAVLGVLAWPDIASLPFTPDLAVICTHARRNLMLLDALGKKAAKPALFFPPRLNSLAISKRVPPAIRCVCLAQTASGCSPRGKG
jgi:acyl-CoA synthetase (NDP forming)